MLRDRAVAEELVQDVMLELWRRRETLSSDGSAQAYLFQATRNRVLNHLRHLKIEQRSEPEVRGESSSTPPADAAMVQQELSTAVQRAVQMSPRPEPPARFAARFSGDAGGSIRGCASPETGTPARTRPR